MRTSTNGAYQNCTDAKTFLQEAGLSCYSDLGSTAPFRFLYVRTISYIL